MKIQAELKVDDVFVDMEIDHQAVVDFIYDNAIKEYGYGSSILILKIQASDNLK